MSDTNYYQKYLKYKKKYLNLKVKTFSKSKLNSSGGAAAEQLHIPQQNFTQNSKDFYIYTTGIINNGSIDDDGQNLIKSWSSGILFNLVSRIPNDFRITIYHYDPMLVIELEPKMKK